MFRKYYNGTTRKMMIAFATLFDNLKIDIDDKEITVPIHMVQGESFYKKLERVPDLSGVVKPIALPVMGYEFISMNPDQDRHTNTLNKIQDQRMQANRQYMYNRMPVSWNFDLHVAVKRMDHGLRIMEQIVSSFQPHLNLTVKVIPELQQEDNIQVVLNSWSHQINYEQNLDEIRTITYTYSFTLKGFLYQDLKSRQTIIDNITNINAMTDEDYDEKFLSIKHHVDDDGEITEEF